MIKLRFHSLYNLYKIKKITQTFGPNIIRLALMSLCVLMKLNALMIDQAAIV